MKNHLEIIANNLSEELNLRKSEVSTSWDPKSNILNRLKDIYLSQLNKNKNKTEFKNELLYNKFIIEKEIEISKHDISNGRDVATLSVVIATLAIIFGFFDQLGMEGFFVSIYFVVSSLLIMYAFYYLKVARRKSESNYLYLEFKLKCIKEALKELEE